MKFIVVSSLTVTYHLRIKMRLLSRHSSITVYSRSDDSLWIVNEMYGFNLKHNLRRTLIFEARCWVPAYISIRRSGSIRVSKEKGSCRQHPWSPTHLVSVSRLSLSILHFFTSSTELLYRYSHSGKLNTKRLHHYTSTYAIYYHRQVVIRMSANCSLCPYNYPALGLRLRCDSQTDDQTWVSTWAMGVTHRQQCRRAVPTPSEVGIPRLWLK